MQCSAVCNNGNNRLTWFVLHKCISLNRLEYTAIIVHIICQWNIDAFRVRINERIGLDIILFMCMRTVCASSSTEMSSSEEELWSLDEREMGLAPIHTAIGLHIFGYTNITMLILHVLQWKQRLYVVIVSAIKIIYNERNTNLEKSEVACMCPLYRHDYPVNASI